MQDIGALIDVVAVLPSFIDAVDRFTFRCHGGQGRIRDNEGQLARASTADTKRGQWMARISPTLNTAQCRHLTGPRYRSGDKDIRSMRPTQADIASFRRRRAGADSLAKVTVKKKRDGIKKRASQLRAKLTISRILTVGGGGGDGDVC